MKKKKRLTLLHAYVHGLMDRVQDLETTTSDLQTKVHDLEQECYNLNPQRLNKLEEFLPVTTNIPPGSVVPRAEDTCASQAKVNNLEGRLSQLEEVHTSLHARVVEDAFEAKDFRKEFCGYVDEVRSMVRNLETRMGQYVSRHDALKDAVASLNLRCDHIPIDAGEQMVGALKTMQQVQVTPLKERVEGLSARLSNQAASLQVLNDQFQILKTNLDVLESRIPPQRAGIIDDVVATREEHYALKRQVDDLKRDFEDKEENCYEVIEQLRKQYQSHQTSVEERYAALDKKLQGRLNILQSMNDKVIESCSLVQALERQHSQLSEAVATIERDYNTRLCLLEDKTEDLPPHINLPRTKVSKMTEEGSELSILYPVQKEIEEEREQTQAKIDARESDPNFGTPVHVKEKKPSLPALNSRLIPCLRPDKETGALRFRLYYMDPERANRYWDVVEYTMPPKLNTVYRVWKRGEHPGWIVLQDPGLESARIKVQVEGPFEDKE